MSLPDDSARNSGPWRRVREFVDSLAGRLLGLTALAVIAGEIFVFAPALAGFHEGWLRERMNLAQIAALALEVSLEDETVTQPLEYDLINSGVQRVAIQREGERILLLEAPNAPNDEDLVVYDYMQASGWQRFRWAVDTFFAPPGRVLRVLARPRVRRSRHECAYSSEVDRRFRRC